MSDEKTPIEALQALRLALLEKRRNAVKAAIDPELAKRGNVAANFDRHAGDVVTLQMQIDAVLRAIADEEGLQPSFWEAQATIT